MKATVSKETVVLLAHHAGMHNDGYSHVRECDICFESSNRYNLNLCEHILMRIGRLDQKTAFKAFLNHRISEAKTDDYREMLWHQHPAYLIANFLGIDYCGKYLEIEPNVSSQLPYKLPGSGFCENDSPEFEKLLKEADYVMGYYKPSIFLS